MEHLVPTLAKPFRWVRASTKSWWMASRMRAESTRMWHIRGQIPVIGGSGPGVFQQQAWRRRQQQHDEAAASGGGSSSMTAAASAGDLLISRCLSLLLLPPPQVECRNGRNNEASTSCCCWKEIEGRTNHVEVTSTEGDMHIYWPGENPLKILWNLSLLC